MGAASIGSALGMFKPVAQGAGRRPSVFDAALDAARAQDRQSVDRAAVSAGKPIGDEPASSTVIPRADADPAAVSAWWASLSSDTRRDLIDDHHAELGRLRGLPAEDSDKINRLRLDEDVERLTEDLRIVVGAIEGAKATGGTADPELYREADRLRTEKENAEKIKDQMERLIGAHEKEGGPRPYLLTYFHQNEGRFAVALGNPDTARNTAVLVPGSGHDVKHERGPFPTVDEGRRLYDEMGAEDPARPSDQGSGQSVIVWLGADMPDAGFPAGANPTYGDAEHGARRLRDDVEGYQASATNFDQHMTVVAHSYGSYMAGEAIQIGMEVDDFVVVGSPGTGAYTVDQLGMRGHVWAAKAENDGVPTAHGLSPTGEDFGAEVFATDGSATLGATDGHGDYLKEDSESLDNIAKIATRDDEHVSRRPPD